MKQLLDIDFLEVLDLILFHYFTVCNLATKVKKTPEIMEWKPLIEGYINVMPDFLQCSCI